MKWLICQAEGPSTTKWPPAHVQPRGEEWPQGKWLSLSLTGLFTDEYQLFAFGLTAKSSLTCAWMRTAFLFQNTARNLWAATSPAVTVFDFCSVSSLRCPKKMQMRQRLDMSWLDTIIGYLAWWSKNLKTNYLTAGKRMPPFPILKCSSQSYLDGFFLN